MSKPVYIEGICLRCKRSSITLDLLHHWCQSCLDTLQLKLNLK